MIIPTQFQVSIFSIYISYMKVSQNEVPPNHPRLFHFSIEIAMVLGIPDFRTPYIGRLWIKHDKTCLVCWISFNCHPLTLPNLLAVSQASSEPDLRSLEPQGSFGKLRTHMQTDEISISYTSMAVTEQISICLDTSLSKHIYTPYIQSTS